jgi:hypothetical protein
MSLRQNAMHSLKAMSTHGHRVAAKHIALAAGIGYPALALEKQAMEMTEYGKP